MGRENSTTRDAPVDGMRDRSPPSFNQLRRCGDSRFIVQFSKASIWLPSITGAKAGSQQLFSNADPSPESTKKEF